jgi:F1F0 ATPase subunit 2
MLDALIGLGTGIVAGGVFFGGLRWTVSRLTHTRRPVLLTSTSFLVRSGFVVFTLLLIADGGLVRILAGLVGMLAVRTALVANSRRSLDSAEASSWT